MMKDIYEEVGEPAALERSILLDGMWSSLKGHWLEGRKDKNG